MANLSNINNKFIVTDGGDVMINNTIAGYPNGEGLTVKSSNNICRVVLQNSVSGGSVNDGFRIGLVNSNVEFENTESGEFQFYTGGGAAKMTIDSSGNVGIGTTSPSQKLDTPNIVIGGSSIAASYRANSTMMDNLGGVARFYSLGPNTSTGGSYQFNSLSSNLTAGVGTVMTILNTGNVGIGTTSPSGKLTISDANATGLEINPLDSQNRVNIMAYDRADSAYREINFDGSNYNFEIANSTKLVINSSGNVIQSGTSPQYQFVTPNNYNFQIAVQENVSNALEITPSTAAGGTTFSTPAVVINSSGNVGIGTTSPGSNLTIKENGVIGFQYTTGAGSFHTITGGGVNPMSFTVNPFSALDPVFSFNSAAGNIMTMKNGGNVGIGTISPSHLLSIGTEGNASGKKLTFYLGGSDGNYAGIGAQRGETNLYCSSEIRFINESNSGGSGAMSFNTGLNSLNERIRITSAGNVGIGTTSPSAKLNVIDGNNTFVTSDTNTYPRLTVAGGSVQLGLFRSSSNVGGGYIGADGSTCFHIRDASFATKLYLTQGGNLGIGTTSPTAKLHVASSVNADVIFKLENTNTGTSAGAKIELIDDEGGSGSGAGALRHSISSISQTAINWVIGSGSAAGQLDFSTVDSFIMRLDESQNVLIGKTSQGLSIAGIEAASNATLRATKNNSSPVEFNRLGTDGDIVLFYKNTAGKGSISITSSAVSYNTSSDYRLKEDLQDFTGLDMVSKIPVYDFKWKTDENRSYGVMAHELQEVLPDAVSGDKDAEEMQGVDYSKIVPLLVKSIQELKAEIELLKSK